ncbi:MAG TPA: hypothetical protein PLR44_00570 [Thermomicrobiales bacterium]|nr:hypothetical protein [Thermomicrobiales bacterium]
MAGDSTITSRPLVAVVPFEAVFLVVVVFAAVFFAGVAPVVVFVAVFFAGVAPAAVFAAVFFAGAVSVAVFVVFVAVVFVVISTQLRRSKRCRYGVRVT